MLRFYGIRAEVLLKLTKEYKPEILCPVRSVSPENILNMLLLTKVLMADVI